MKITIIGKSNASVAMILEIIYLTYTPPFEVVIIKNMSDTNNLPYKIDNMTITEINDEDYTHYENDSIYIIGAFRVSAKTSIKQYFFNKYNLKSEFFCNVISPSSTIASTVSLGNGCIISHQCVIDSYTKLADFVTVNRCCSIGHHTDIGKNTTIGPNAHIAGNCVIGNNVQICMSSTIIDGITIGDNTIIGANSFVNKNIPANVVAYGSPAKIIRSLDLIKHN